MKRTEMIKALQSRFCTSDVDAIADLADEIINFLESQGMQPPAYKKTVLADNGFGFNNNFYVQTFVNKWEPENATQNHSTYCDNNVEPASAERPLR